MKRPNDPDQSGSLDAPGSILAKRLRSDSIITLTNGSRIAVTERFKVALEAIDKAVKAEIPVLVEGCAGVGKTVLLESYAQLCDRQDLVTINVGEQTDAKALVGLYAADESRPGFFRWIPGVLTEALRHGSWLLIEDVHLASMEIITALLSVIQSRKLFIHSTGETIVAESAFRVFATKTGKSSSGPFEDLLGSIWYRVHLEQPEKQELSQIIRQSLSPILVDLVLKIHEAALLMTELGRSPLVRFMFRLCERLALYQLKVENGIDEPTRRLVLLEAYDVYGAALPKKQNREIVIKMLCEILYLSQDADLIFDRHPELTFAPDHLQIGRVSIPRRPLASKSQGLAPTKLSRQILERLAFNVQLNFPVLLVGETGTGKTTLVQELARLTGHGKLDVLNMSQQTEASDLLGGFRPLSSKLLAKGLFDQFERIFSRSVIQAKNQAYFQEIVQAFQKENWPRFTKLIRQVVDALVKRQPSDELAELGKKLESFEGQVQFMKKNVLFGYVEGALVEAIKEGHWILLDEINLASNETLEVLSGLLRSNSASVHLSERGDSQPIQRHPNFRLFACMNPATDVAKKDLPASIRYKFSEIYVDETDVYSEDLKMFIEHQIGTGSNAGAIATLYYRFKEAILSHELVDGSNHRPLLNLRTLSRALKFSRKTQGLYGFSRSLYEGFCLSFTTTLRADCRLKAEKILADGLGLTAIGPLRPNSTEVERFLPGANKKIVDGYILEIGSTESKPEELAKFILTPSSKQKISQLSRAIMAQGYPILLEGPTSAGKTSAVEYLCAFTGHRFVRINNHEHTDIQEYLGAYQPDSKTGQLVFKEGLLVEALRNGYWLVLDELNLAPSDVLEALNRLLDDNRELYVAELNEVIKPHPEFLLFATQNPAGLYGGRKVLSKAFRSRFLELQVDDLPVDEVELIITQRCSIAPSHAKKVSQVYRQLQEKRQTAANVFAGRHALITLRDLFRWGNREHSTAEQLAENGFMVLAERARHEEERALIKSTIESVFKCPIDLERIYDIRRMAIERGWNQTILTALEGSKVTWTKAMQRTFCLVYQCYLAGEPVLLVGETGCGKTTVCQVLADILACPLSILNCHQNTETSDILGCLRPSRDQQESSSSMFSWYDGPLVQAMKQGSLFMLDEISLADDSVLERLNSVLEPQGKLVLAECIGDENQVIAPAKGFAIFSTMNPGGDYGKKELSPALRNRFTEIWVPSIGDWEDVRLILTRELGGSIEVASKMVEFLNWWQSLISQIPFLSRWIISLRDILSWARFTMKFSHSNNGDLRLGFVHAAIMLFIDPALSRTQREEAHSVLEDYKKACFLKLVELAGLDADFSLLAPEQTSVVLKEDGRFGIAPFFVESKSDGSSPSTHSLTAPTTFNCAYRVLRSMQLGGAILLEGSPGVGKTTLIESLAKLTGNQLVRINLSDQTDLIDLFGTDLPVEGGAVGQFSWCDGPFLRAMKQGDWILLDELNLASQSVLEGLNACLDHRGSVFIPELGRTFAVNAATRIFAAQNPLRQGGGRKGLPKSFVNRFVTVWFDQLTIEDYKVICKERFPQLPTSLIDRAIEFNRQLTCMLNDVGGFALKGRPWEFNLRDLFRWLRLTLVSSGSPLAGFRTIYLNRLRTLEDRRALIHLYERVFPDMKYEQLIPYRIENGALHVGPSAQLEMKGSTQLSLLRSQLPSLESILMSMAEAWLIILVGPTGSGKTGLVEFIADLSGVRLVQFQLGPETDTLELLGSFEQTDYDRKYRKLAFKYGLNCIGEADLDGNDLLRQELEALQLEESASKGAQFEWVDGPLTVALQEGHWIILENANLCSPAVLDRLNSLFEPGGTLVLTEASGHQEGMRTLRPHPNFRLFMTLDPRHGELSRAMRNRGVEVYLLNQIQPVGSRYDQCDMAAKHLSLLDGPVLAGIIAADQSSDLRSFKRSLAIIKSNPQEQPTPIPTDDDPFLSVAWPSDLFKTGQLFAFEAQAKLLSYYLSQSSSILSLPLIVDFLACASPADFSHRRQLLKDVCPEIISKIPVDLTIPLPNYSLDILGSNLLTSFKTQLLGIVFGTATPDQVLSMICPPSKPLKQLSESEELFKEDWSRSSACFGFLNKDILQLLKRLGPMMDDPRAQALLPTIIKYNLGEAMGNIESIRNTLNEIEASWQPEVTSELSPLELAISKLSKLHALLSSEKHSDGLKIGHAHFDAIYQQLSVTEKFTSDYADFSVLVQDAAKSISEYGRCLSIKELKESKGVIMKLNDLVKRLHEVDMTVDKSQFRAHILQRQSSESILQEISEFITVAIDPVTDYYVPYVDLKGKLLSVQQAELEFYQKIQDFMYGYHQDDDEQVLDKTYQEITDCSKLIRYRDTCLPSLESIKTLLSSVNMNAQDPAQLLENLKSLYGRLKCSLIIPYDLAVKPLMLVGQLLCELIHDYPRPVITPLLVYGSRWFYESLLDKPETLLVAFEMHRLSAMLSGSPLNPKLLLRLAQSLTFDDALKNNRDGDAELEVHQIFSQKTSSKEQMNQKIAAALLDMERPVKREDWINLIESIVTSTFTEKISPYTFPLLAEKHFSSDHRCEKNFFTHICPEHIESVIEAIKRFTGRLGQLLSQYPEHDTLQSLQKISDRLLNSKVSDMNLFSLSSQIEFLLSKVLVWQGVCSSSDSLAVEVDGLMDELFGLRKLEMESWKRLKEHLEMNYRQAAFTKWSWVTRLVLSGDVEDQVKLLELFDMFLQGCPLGEFKHRLTLFSKVSDLAPSEAVRVLSKNVASYYAQFLPRLDHHLAGQLDSVIQELRGFIVSVRWNDKNILAHIECSKKVHNQVMKAYKKMQDVYQMPTSSMLTRLPSSTQNASNDSKKVDNELESLTGKIFERMAELKQLKGKDAVKQKQNAIVDLFKTLKHIGIRLHRQFDDEQCSVRSLLLGLPEMPADEEYTFRCLVGWNEIQTLLGSPHEDNIPRQVEIFKSALLQLFKLISQYFGSWKELDSLKPVDYMPEGSLLLHSPDKIVKLLSLNLAMLEELRVVNVIDEAEVQFYREAIRKVKPGFVSREDLPWIKANISVTPRLPEDLAAGFADLIRSNNLKVYKLLREATDTSFTEMSVPFEFSFDGDLGDFEIPKDFLLTALSIPTSFKAMSKIELEGAKEFYLGVGRSLGKFTHLIGSVFTELLRSGFCRPPPEDEAGEEGTSDQVADGVGMAEGTGDKNVSEEMEFEGQVADLANDNKEEQGDDGNKGPDEDDGLEMEEDFNAALDDLAGDDNEDDEKDKDDGEEQSEPKDQQGQNEGLENQDESEMNADQQQQENNMEMISDDEDLEKRSIEDDAQAKEDAPATEDLQEKSMDLGDSDLDALSEASGFSQDEYDDDDDNADKDGEFGQEDAQMTDDEMEDVERADIVQDEPEDIEEQMEDIEDEDDEQQLDTSQDKTKGIGNGMEKEEQQDDEEQAEEGKVDAEKSSGAASEQTPVNQAKTDQPETDETQGAAAKSLDELLENIYKSVHNILEEDKNIPKEPVGQQEFSKDQQFQHSTDAENEIGLVAPMMDLDDVPLDRRIDTSQQDEVDKMDLEEEQHGDETEEAEQTEMKKGRRKEGTVEIGERAEPEETSKDLRDWDRIESDMSLLAGELCEQLRLVLEPTKASKLKGDYKTGKRLNLRKLIPYLISQYRKDRIWLRRTKPNKRSYNLTLSIDNSRSMKDHGCDLLALQSASLLSQALRKLEAGRLGVIGFGSHASTIIPLAEGGASTACLLDHLRFDSDRTDVLAMMQQVIECFQGQGGGGDLGDFPWNLNIILSDGICENHEALRVKLNEAFQLRILNIFVILDPASSQPNGQGSTDHNQKHQAQQQQSITDMSQVTYEPVLDADGRPIPGKTVVKMRKYLETFPFDNYIVVRNLEELPGVLAEAIKQWFELLTTLE